MLAGVGRRGPVLFFIFFLFLVHTNNGKRIKGICNFEELDMHANLVEDGGEPKLGLGNTPWKSLTD